MGDDDLIYSIGNISSEHDDYSVTYTSTGDDKIALDLADVTDSGTEFTYNMPGVSSSIDFPQVDFESTMPSIYKVNNMCKHYPALSKAYENFKTIYKMVEQDYKGNYEDKDEIPF